MNINLPYFANVAIAITVFYLAYLLLFSKEKMFVFNRIYLITSMLVSFIIPLITFTEQIVIPSTAEVVGTVIETASIASETYPPIFLFGLTLNQLLALLFISGFVFFLTTLIIGHIKAMIIIKKSSNQSLYGYHVKVTQKDIPPFTYFNKLTIPSKIINTAHIQSVIRHENIHKEGRHCIDILLMEIMFLFQWFNPFAWLMKKAVKDNLEFLTDEKVTGLIDKQEYQLVIISLAGKTTFYTFPSLSNQSQLKKRIIMMAKNKQSKFRWLRALIIIPMLAIMTFTLSGREVQVIYPETVQEETSITEDKVIKGTVSDENGKPIAGASIIVKNSTYGTISDLEGNFELQNIKKDTVLTISMIDYNNGEVHIGDAEKISIVLSKSLDNTPTKTTASNTTKSKEVTDKEIKGEVKDENGKPIAGVSVTVKGSTLGTVTDMEGNFLLKNIPNTVVLSFVMIGYEKKEMPLTIETGDKTNKESYFVKVDMITVQLKKSTSDATSVIISKVNKNNNNNEPLIIIDGIVNDDFARIESKDISSVSILKAQDAIDKYGEDAINGVVIITTKSEAEKQNNTTISDTDTTHQKNLEFHSIAKNALIIVDDKIYTPGEFDTKQLDPNDIKLIEILKYGNAIELYGDEAKNGVVIITTKKKAEKQNIIESGANHTTRSTDSVFHLSSSSTPIFIVDGKQYVPGEFDTKQLNPHDIESVSILKDKTTTEIYGDDGKNGVIFITTKK